MWHNTQHKQQGKASNICLKSETKEKEKDKGAKKKSEK